MIENPFNHKAVAKELLAVYMPASGHKRRTRTWLRKMARHIEHAYEIGFRDGRERKPIPALDDILEYVGYPRNQEMINRAYTAYQAGYKAGEVIA